MKSLKNIYAVAAFGLLASVASCVSDDGNYDYLTPEQAGEIKFDTVGMDPAMRNGLYSLQPNQHVEYNLKVKYVHPENLDYAWLAFKTNFNSYVAEQVGNAMIYPKPDTIGRQLALNWDVNLNPGTYKIYLQAKDRTNGMMAYFYPCGQYTTLTQEGKVSGMYMLVERDGQTDIEAMGSALMLITGTHSEPKFYSGIAGKYLPGKPVFIRGTFTTSGKTSKDGYMVATTEGLFRLNSTGLVTMDSWEDLFYTVPEKFNPQISKYNSSTGCDMLINDGKLHVVYGNKANDRKYSDAIAGDYEAYPYLMHAGRETWRPNPEHINADQVIYDKKSHSFRPYYPMAASLSKFKSTSPDAYADANNLPADPVVILNGANSATWAILDYKGSRWLYQFQFSGVFDDGDLSYGGERAIQNLDGCTNIKNAKLWASNTAGGAFYYATDDAVYSYSTTSGATTSNTVYTCEPGEVVTALYIYGSDGGGWPTSNCAFWIATWNETTKNGRLIQYEMDINNGVPNDQWGPMFGAAPGAYITDGWGKIISMTMLGAE